MNRKALWTYLQPSCRQDEVPKRKPKRIRGVSRARSKRLKAYSKRAAEWKNGKACCFPNCTKEAADVHHWRGRIGSLLTDERYWLPVCRTHHRWIGDNPNEARCMGLLAPTGLWNTTERQ